MSVFCDRVVVWVAVLRVVAFLQVVDAVQMEIYAPGVMRRSRPRQADVDSLEPRQKEDAKKDGWILGGRDQSCTEACFNMGLVCNKGSVAKMNAMTDRGKMSILPGHNRCKSFHPNNYVTGPCYYDKSPTNQGRCDYQMAGAPVTCGGTYKRAGTHLRRFCYCEDRRGYHRYKYGLMRRDDNHQADGDSSEPRQKEEAENRQVDGVSSEPREEEEEKARNHQVDGDSAGHRQKEEAKNHQVDGDSSEPRQKGLMRRGDHQQADGDSSEPRQKEEKATNRQVDGDSSEPQ